jgi:hypothetical protein
MKFGLIIWLCVFSQVVFADGLPVITVQPASQIVSPGNTATLTVTATGATSFQWRFNGADISGATNSTLQVPNAQTNNAGYYMAVAKNATGWVPSQMAWLSVVSGPGGEVPFSNLTNTGIYGGWLAAVPIDSGTAQVIAGPALDQMQPVSWTAPVTNGYFDGVDFNFPPWPPFTIYPQVPTVAPGQTVYYRVDYVATGDTFVRPSTVLKLVAGGGPYPIPSAGDLLFPYWIEWPDPRFIEWGSTSTNQVRITGETVSFTNVYIACADFGWPTVQWRKDGNVLNGATNFAGSGPCGQWTTVFTITNVQAADAGNYDVFVTGNYWLVQPQISLSVQITNGPGVFQSPRFRGTNFVCDLLGAAGRNYTIQWSTNLSNWNDLRTVSNVTGTITFTNSPALGGARFYRARLQP